MNLLLDTHVLLWWLNESSQLSKNAEQAIASPENSVFISAVVIWECRIKESLGKLQLPKNFGDVVSNQPFSELRVTSHHAHRVCELPAIHRDPFDRMLASQSRLEGLSLVTADDTLQKYPIHTLW